MQKALFQYIFAERSHRTVGSGVAVFLIYVFYALLVSPIVEPSPPERSTINISSSQYAQGTKLRSMRDFEGLFPADSWVYKEPKILETDRMLMLWQEHSTMGDRRIKLYPFTVILKPNDHEDTLLSYEQRKRQSIILEAMDGAILSFSEPLDFKHGEIGELESGILQGEVRIHSQGRREGPIDDLNILTRDIHLSRRDIRTDSPVNFRFGPNYGSGKGLRIRLSDSDTNKSDDISTRIEMFQLAKIDRIHISPAHLQEVSGDPSDDATTTNALPNQQTPSASSVATSPIMPFGEDGSNDDLLESPVEITCKGPFCFNLIDRVATFSDQVDIVRINSNGLSDQMNCQLLTIFFEPPGETSGTAKDENFAFVPQQIEATGSPVTINAPSRQAEARGRRLAYDVGQRRLTLEGLEEAYLRYGPNEILARIVVYTAIEGSQLGRVVATGPGQIIAETAERPDQRFKATWKERLWVRPDKNQQLISLTGGTTLFAQGIGKLEAENIHFWLTEHKIEGPQPKTELLPNRMLAQNNVSVDSPQVEGTVEQLQIWFEQSSVPLAANETSAAGRTDSGIIGNNDLGIVSTTNATGENESQTPLLNATSSKNRFQVHGRTLQGRVLMAPDRNELSEMTLEEDVRLTEVQIGEETDELPLIITGDKVWIRDVTRDSAIVTLLGKPAHFEARGLTLNGSNIHFNRSEGRVWVNGPGSLAVLVSKDLEGRPLTSADQIHVTWQQGMSLAGRTIRFDHAVQASTTAQRLWTETLELHLSQPVDFSAKPDRRSQPELEQVLCRGGGRLENYTFEGQQRVSLERLLVQDLTLNLRTGAVTAGGPGRVESLRRGSAAGGLSALTGGGMPGTSAQGTTVNRSAYNPGATSGSDPNSLQALTITFQGSITGNTNRRQMTFHDQVRTAMSRVDRWDARLPTDDPAALGEEGALLGCDHLTVVQVKSPTDGTESLELEAVGNTVVEGHLFTARATRIGYAQVKDLLVLEGDNRTDAQLYRRQVIGGPASCAAARRIYFWPQTKRLKIDNARSLEITGAGGRMWQ